jgi:polyhydroxybutyrate depolymerase
VDDVAFLRALIGHLDKTYGVDRTRVYATGISNGGFMSYRLGLELSDELAAIAPVTANLQKVHVGKVPSHPVGLMVLNGTKDPLVPYDGGHVRVFGVSRGAILSTDETIRRWIAFTGAEKEPKVEALPDRDSEDGTRATVSRWAAGAKGAEVALVRIESGGHTWPGGTQYLSPKLIGRTSRDFAAVPLMFDFFARHQRKTPDPE